MDRKSTYKLPLRDKLLSQETRRNKALEDQKRRRAQRIDSARQLDLFAGLNLGGSDDEDDDEDGESIQISPASVAQYASMLAQPQNSNMVNAITSFEHVILPAASIGGETSPTSYPHDGQERDVESKKRSKKRKNPKRKSNKPTKWADSCMYAELLEMASDEPWSGGYVPEDGNEDGLPRDLETGWVALAPVPAGKRCLAVTHQSAGVAGVVPNTTLRSRLLGKTLIQRFPSSLPPLTILDCILDVNWRDNGILHILDVVKWKGQDVGDCEAGFRFWWRDTRLAELTQTLPLSSTSLPSSSKKYRFPYPTTFIPVPCHTSTTLSSLDSIIVPAARTVREVDVKIPLPSSMTPSSTQESMDIEPLPPVSSPNRPTSSQNFETTPGTAPSSTFAQIANQTHNRNVQTSQSQIIKAQIQPDGLLLYVAESSYEPGTSPLSSWVPITVYEQKDYERERDEGVVGEPDDRQQGIRSTPTKPNESPLNLFERLVRKRLALSMSGRQVTEASSMACSVALSDVEMDV